ncbi:MAG: hypothetical protein IJP45_02410, partial [Paludibacteraceae bacterium]|nr:hypothetical protein [Paludibacteraceae bacterium]
MNNEVNRALVAKKKHFLLTLIAFIGMSLPLMADDPNWASMGADMGAMLGASGKYYLYNVGTDAFLGEGVVTDDPQEAKELDVAFGDMDELTFCAANYYIWYTDAGSIKHYVSTSGWTTDMAVAKNGYFLQSSHQYRLGTEDGMPTYIKIDAGELSACVDFMGICTPDANCNWVFIPKTDFETALASLTPEPEPEGIADGFYYLYNVATSKYFTGMINASGLTDDNAKAALYYISKVDGEDTYKFAYAANRTSNGSTTSPSYTGINKNTNTGVGLLVEKSTQAVQQKLTIESIEGTNNVLIYRNIDDVNRYLCYDATNNKPNVKDGTSDNNCKWILKPVAGFKADVTAAWASDAYAQKAVAISDKQFFYLYNPAAGVFMAYNGSSASLNTNPKMAEPFYVIKSGDNYLIKTEKTNGSVVFASPNWNATSTALTLTETEVNGKKMYSIVDNSSSVKKSLSICKNRTEGNANSYFNYIQTTVATYPYTADIAATDILDLWVLIPKSESLNTPDAFDPSDTWAAKGTTDISAGRQFYLYNPATKTFAYNSGLTTSASSAYLYTLRPLTGDNDGKFEIAYPDWDFINENADVKYVGYNSNTSANAMPFTLERVGETNHYRIYYELDMTEYELGITQYYVTTKRTAVSGDVSTYARYYWTDYGEDKYIYTPDGFSEWILIPDSEYEQVVTPQPSPEEEDILASGGKNPQNAVAYKMYNVGAKRFLHYETMTDDNSLADDCTIGRDGSSSTVTIQKDMSGTYTGYYLTTNGHNSTAYELTIEEVAGHPGQYYVYKTVGDYDIHLRASWNDATKYASEAVRSDGDKSTLSDKCRWTFLEPKTVYYKAKAEIYAGEGTLRVAFTSGDVASADDETDVTSAGSLVENLPLNVYYKAEPETGYQFMGWKLDPDGPFISTDAEYTYTEFTASSTDSEHPDNVTLYAYFEKYDAELYNANGIKQDDYETLAGALTAASKGYTVKLKRNITSAQTINKAVTLDFNGYTISGSADNLVTVTVGASDTVTFVDNSIAGNGGVTLSYEESEGNSSLTAIKLTAGTLVVNNGYYEAAQTWDDHERSGQAYVLNCAGGNVRVNGGRFKATKYGASNHVTQYVHIFNGSNIQLYGGYYTSDDNGNISNRAGEDMEVVATGDAPYAYTLRNKYDVNDAVATADGKGFSSLADAIAYANNNAGTEMVIRLAKDHTLPAGTYTIPAKATLIIPYNAMHTEPLVACPLLNNSRLPGGAYKTLTLANGVHINVYGAIELGGCAHSYGNGATGTGRPNSDYGHLIMNEGSQIILNNGAKLRAWGFVTGSGTIDVRRGARVDEMFQVYDFKGGNGTLAMYSGGHKSFPIQQYFIQNVEVKTTYRPGSSLYSTMAAVAIGVSVKIIGMEGESSSLFMMDNKDDSEDTWVCKWYNPATDQQVYDINNSASISNLYLPLSKMTGVGGSDFDSKDYILPITNNMKIHLLSGDMTITQDVAFLPGTELEINKLCTGHIKKNTTTCLYDADQWGAYTYNNAYASKIKYRPGGVPNVRDISSAAALGDAKANIHGTIEVNGSFRTTEGGAYIYSTNEDAGTVSFTSTAVTTYDENRDTLCTWTGQVYHPASSDNNWQASATPSYEHFAAYPAKLKNVSGFTSTTTAEAGTNSGKSFCYIENEWRLLTDDGCMVTDGTNYYIKPQAYVQLSSNTEDEEHLYHAANDATRDFILTLDDGGNCQWWEVEDVAGHPELKHSTHPENDVYYYYDNDAEDWLEKRFSVTWMNWDGSNIETYQVRYGSQPQYFGSTPTRERTQYYTYDFAGWTPALTTVTADAVYTAVYEEKPVPVQELSDMNITDEQTVSDNQDVSNLRITTTGSLNVTGSITADNLYLESDGSTASGQIVGGEDNITATHVYFDFKANAKNHQWYAVAVPWQVDATSGISVNGRTLTLGKDFDIIYYNGALRAEKGKQKCWSYVENDDDKTLYPGRLYMIALMSDAPVIRFAKKDGAALLTTTTSVTAHAQTTGDDKDANWNGVANPALFHAYVNAGTTVGQVYNPDNNSYDPVTMSSAKMVVGQGAFVQAPADKNLTVAYGGAFAAPRRAKAAGALHDIRIAPADDAYTDRLFIQTDEDKEQNTYT